MASKYVKKLEEAAEVLQQQGFPISAAACKNGATRMEAMEDLIVAMQEQIDGSTTEKWEKDSL